MDGKGPRAMLAGDANADIMRIVIECIRERTMRGQSGDFEPHGLPDAKKSPVHALLWTSAQAPISLKLLSLPNSWNSRPA